MKRLEANAPAVFILHSGDVILLPILTFHLSVHLALKMASSQVIALVTVRNQEANAIKLEDLVNRDAISFFVTDSQGHVVSPSFYAKVDPRNSVLDLKPGQEVSREFPSLRFITRTGGVEYLLSPGGTYRVVAVYRPNRQEGAGIGSNEVTIHVGP